MHSQIVYGARGLKRRWPWSSSRPWLRRWSQRLRWYRATGSGAQRWMEIPVHWLESVNITDFTISILVSFHLGATFRSIYLYSSFLPKRESILNSSRMPNRTVHLPNMKHRSRSPTRNYGFDFTCYNGSVSTRCRIKY